MDAHIQSAKCIQQQVRTLNNSKWCPFISEVPASVYNSRQVYSTKYPAALVLTNVPGEPDRATTDQLKSHLKQQQKNPHNQYTQAQPSTHL